eukprot:COSAG05_NODE_379_length_10567_cov_18.553687_7_plen_67_part_00
MKAAARHPVRNVAGYPPQAGRTSQPQPARLTPGTMFLSTHARGPLGADAHQISSFSVSGLIPKDIA